jgi:hypothetical protein
VSAAETSYWRGNDRDRPRFPLAFDGILQGQVLRIFTDTLASNYRMAERSIPDGECGPVTVIQRAKSDLRLSPHFHVLQLDGAYAPGRDEVSLLK